MEHNWATHIVKIKKAKLLPILSCNICGELLEDPTAIDECLHLFCRKCIYDKITEEDLEHCPVCNIHLGPEPRDRLRDDRAIRSLRYKFFPPSESKVEASDAGSSRAIETKRSLSPLNVNTPKETITNDNDTKDQDIPSSLDIPNKLTGNSGQFIDHGETKNDVVMKDASDVVEADVMEATGERKSFSSDVKGSGVELEPMKVNDTESQVKKSKRKKKGRKTNAEDEKISTNVQGLEDAELGLMKVKDIVSEVKKFKKMEKGDKANAEDEKISANVKGSNAELEPTKVNDSDSQVKKSNEMGKGHITNVQGHDDAELGLMKIKDIVSEVKRSKGKEKGHNGNAEVGKINTDLQWFDAKLEPMKGKDSDSQVKKSKKKTKRHNENAKDGKISTNVQGLDAELGLMKLKDIVSDVKKSKEKEKVHNENAEDGKISTNVQGLDAELGLMKLKDIVSEVKKSKEKEKVHNENAEDGKNSTDLQGFDAKIEHMKEKDSDSQVKKSTVKEKEHKANNVEDGKIITIVPAGPNVELEPMKVNEGESQVKKSKEKGKACKVNAEDNKITTNVDGPNAELELMMKVNDGDSQVKESIKKEIKRELDDEDEKIINYLVSPNTAKIQKGIKACQKKEPISEESSKLPQVVQDPTEAKFLKNKTVWISLVASENQEGDAPLPQIRKKYIRIKDQSPVIFHVKKYLMKKLSLESEDEVKITCLEQPVPLVMELQELAAWWFENSNGEATTYFGASAEDFIVVLNYGRNVTHP